MLLKRPVEAVPNDLRNLIITNKNDLNIHTRLNSINGEQNMAKSKEFFIAGESRNINVNFDLAFHP